MNVKYFLFGGFILMVLAQLYVPSKMILDKEKIFQEGTTFRFKTRPVDPNDPFRGKYVRLHFDRIQIPTSRSTHWNKEDKAYVTFATDSSGFAYAKHISNTPPTDSKDYMQISLRKKWIAGDSNPKIILPFDRFYMTESKARPAELAYNEIGRDTSKQSYALVNIWNGDYVLWEVMVGGLPIKEVAVLIFSRLTFACNCIEFIHNFCESISGEDIIVLATISDSIADDRTKIEVIEEISNWVILADELTVEGGGAVCGEEMSLFSAGDTVIFAMTVQIYSYPIDTLFLEGVCVKKFLAYENGKVIGRIQEDVLEMEYETFVNNISECKSYTSAKNIDPISIEVFPNPTGDFISINSPYRSINSIDVYSLSGIKVMQFKSDQSNNLNLDLSTLSPGIYFARIKTKNGEYIKRISKM